MTTKEFLEKYPMVLETDVNQLTSHVRLEMISYYEDLEDPNYHPEDDQEEDHDDDYTIFNDSILSQGRFHIIASTSFYMSETFFFPSIDGVNHTLEELGCSMAERWGDSEFDNEDEIFSRLSDHFPGYLIEKKDTFNIHSDMGHIVKRVYSLSKLA
jgi:hypothetical protein